MRLDLQFRIRNNPNLYRYLQYHSYLYKTLNRNPHFLKEVEEDMKKEYKLTTADKLTNLNKRMQMLRSFLDIIN